MNSVEKLFSKIKENEAVVFIKPENRRYFTGMNTSNGLLLATSDKAWFFTDFRYIVDAKIKVKDPVKVELLDGSFVNTVKKKLEAEGKNVTKIYLEQGYLSYLSVKSFMDGLTGYEFDNGDNFAASLRVEKTEEEISYIKQAQKITDDAFTHIVDYIYSNWKKGITEKDIAFELEFHMRKNGAKGLAFDTIVASGANGAMCHAVPSDKPINDGDMITMDYGAAFNDYCSDMTRTVAVGHVNEEQEKIYNIVLEAQLNALKNIKAGLTGKECDAFARDIIEKAGYGPDFGHSLGHGVGINIHEGPNFSSAYTGVINVNAVMSVEPGIYLEGNCGVRIEDLVVVKENGAEDITHSEKKLLIL